jgi:hypothetical protein
MKASHLVLKPLQTKIIRYILGAFAKLRKGTISFVMSLRLSVYPSIRPSAGKYSGPTGRIFKKSHFLGIYFGKSVQKIQVSLKSDTTKFELLRFFWISVQKIHASLKFDKNNGNVTWRTMYIYDNMSMNSSSKRNISYGASKENKNTILRSIIFFYENSVVY